MKFKIQPAKAENKIIAMEYDTSIGYAKGGAKPKVSSVTVELVDTYGNPYVEVLTEGKDYVVSYANNKVVTTSETRKRPMITVKGKAITVGFLQQENLRLCHRISLKWIL